MCNMEIYVHSDIPYYAQNEQQRYHMNRVHNNIPHTQA